MYGQEKNEKKPRTYRSIVCAAGSGSMAAMKDGVHARGARVIRQPPPFSSISCSGALTWRAPCACGRELSSGTYFPHGEWWPVRALRALQHLSSRGYALPSSTMEFEAVASTTLFVVFSSMRKRHILFLWKGEPCSFLCGKKRTKRSRERTVRSFLRLAAVQWRL